MLAAIRRLKFLIPTLPIERQRPPTTMKIAALFVGRFKAYEKTRDSILKHIFADHDVDVFFSHNAANKDDNLQDFAAKYNVKLSDSIEIPIPESIRNYHATTDRKNDGGMFPMFFHMTNGMRLIEEYVQKTGVHYDVVLYLRADMHFMSRVLFKVRDANTVYIPSLCDYCGICDQMAYGTLEAMKKYAATSTHMEQYFTVNKVSCHPETLLLHHIRTHGLRVVRFRMKARLDSHRKA
jgi:hypothetical protein